MTWDIGRGGEGPADTEQNMNRTEEICIGGSKMKSRVRSYHRWSMVFLCLVALFGAAGPCWAQVVPYQFQPGTTIKAQEVNDNFSYLGTSLPRIKWGPTSSSVALTTDWQNLTSFTVTPPAAGNLLLIARATVDIHYNQDSPISPFVHVCISDTPNGGAGGDCGDVQFAVPAQGSAGSRLTVPITLVSPTPDLVAWTPVTYYLNGQISQALSEVTVTASGGFFAVFTAGILQ